MSQVHKVTILNKPFKIRGYTILQWIIIGASAILAFVGATKVPSDWKVGNLPVGLFVFIAILGAGGAYITATQMKPFAWWRNKIFYGLKLAPTVYLPKREEGQVYPDPTITERPKREEHTYVINH